MQFYKIPLLDPVAGRFVLGELARLFELAWREPFHGAVLVDECPDFGNDQARHDSARVLQSPDRHVRHFLLDDVPAVKQR